MDGTHHRAVLVHPKCWMTSNTDNWQCKEHVDHEPQRQKQRRANNLAVIMRENVDIVLSDQQNVFAWKKTEINFISAICAPACLRQRRRQTRSGEKTTRGNAFQVLQWRPSCRLMIMEVGGGVGWTLVPAGSGETLKAGAHFQEPREASALSSSTRHLCCM